MPETEFDPEQFQRIIAYYRDCLAVEARRSLWLPISDEGSRFFQLKLGSEWKLSGKRELSARLSGKNHHFASEFQLGGVMSEVVYGYPILLQRNRKTGQMGVVPVFMQSVTPEMDNNRLTVWLDDELPHLNEEFVLASGGDSAEARRPLETALGFTEESELPKDALSYFARNLAGSTDLPQHEPIDPERIQGNSHFNTNYAEGLYNRHALAIAQRTNFTVGLENELQSLVETPHLSNVDTTSLRFFFGAVPSADPPDATDDESEHRVIEVVPLNDEQRRAVQSAFQNDLTVVTGPPGTGKSQVVTTVIANAWLQEKSVLFASNNHKAVDVVEKRVRELGGRPAIIRTGRKSGNRDLRNEIFEFLDDFLSSRVDEIDRRELKENRRTMCLIEAEKEEISTKLEEVRLCRNLVDKLDREIEDLSTNLRGVDGKIAEAHDLRERDRESLDRQICEIETLVGRLKRDRDADAEIRDREIASIGEQIQQLQSVVQALHDEGCQVDVNDGRFDDAFRADIENLNQSVASLQRNSEQQRLMRDEQITILKYRLDRLSVDFDAHRWNRHHGLDSAQFENWMVEVQSILDRHSDPVGSMWSRVSNFWRRSTDFRRVMELSEEWSEIFDIVGTPPKSPATVEGLESWAKYITNALNNLSDWEKESQRNGELRREIEEIESEINQIRMRFEELGFELQKSKLRNDLAERVKREIETQHEKIIRCRKDISAANVAYDRKRFEERIARATLKIDCLKVEHEARHRARLPELEAKREDIRSLLRGRRSRYMEALKKLAALPKVSDLASNLNRIEKQLWVAGAALFESWMKVLPDRLDIDTKRSIGDFGASLKRLINDEERGISYWELKSDLERLFPTLISALPAWCVTNLSARGGNLPLHAGLFDLVVIDEASQCNIPSALPLMYRAKRATIIGDPYQMQHITSIGAREEQRLQENHAMISAKDQSFLFSQESLYNLGRRNVGDGLHSIREHFRSHSHIVGFSNTRWYSDRLRICTNYDELSIPNGYAAGICWANVSGRVVRSSNGNINDAEAEKVTEQVVEVVKNRGFRGSVGIVTPFRGQANLIGAKLKGRLDLSEMRRCDLVTDTVHGFQGDEKDVVFFSPCVGFDMPSGAERFLSGTGNLFNVAITRARALLFVVGDLKACLASDIAHIKGFAEYCNEIINPKDRVDEPYGFKDGPNVGYWEKRFFEALCDAGLNPTHQYMEGQNRLDFAFETENVKLNVEVDGELYHREWDGSRSRQDLMRDHRLLSQGWTVKRFWVYEIRDELERCVAETKELLL